MSVELLTEHRFEFLSLKGGCTGLSESILVKMPHCWKSHAAAQLLLEELRVLKIEKEIIQYPPKSYIWNASNVQHNKCFN